MLGIIKNSLLSGNKNIFQFGLAVGVAIEKCSYSRLQIKTKI